MKLVTMALKGLAVAVVCLAAMVLFTSTASAQTQEPITQTLTTGEEVEGVDLVLLIDNSVSMYVETDLEGNRIGPGNDVKKLRIESARYIMELLGFDNLFQHADGENRIGVITFGGSGTAYPDISLESLKTSSEKEWQGRYAVLSDQIDENSKGATDPKSAFTKAAEMFAQADLAPGPRAKGIILLTDGVPNVAPTKRCGMEDDTWCRNYFDNLEQVILEKFPAASGERATDGFHIWVVSMNEDWEVVRPKWEEIVGDHWRLIDTAADIAGVFNEIIGDIYSLCALPGSADCVIGEQFAMPPYLDRAVFSIFSSGPLTGQDPITFFNEMDVALDQTDYQTTIQDFGEMIRRITVMDPQPGLWRYEARGDLEVKVRFDPLFGNIQLVEPAGEQSQLSSLVPRFRMFNRRGGIMEEQERFRLTLSGQIVMPNAKDQIPLGDFRYTGNGIWSAGQAISLTKVGEYSLVITGKTVDSENKEITIFPPSLHSFSVAAVDAQLESPPAGKAQQPLGPVQVVYQVIDATQVPLDVDPNLDVKLQLQVQSPSGATQTLDMSPVGGGQFSAPIFLLEMGPQPYTLSVEGWLETPEGQQQLFNIQGDKLDVGTLRVNKVAPDGGKEHTQVALRFEIVDDYGNGLDLGVTSALDFSGSYAVSPSGRQISPLGVQPLSGDHGETSATLYADEWGDWQIHFEAFAKDAGGNPSELVVGDWTLAIIDSVPLKLVILEPGAGDEISLRSVPRVWPFLSGKPNPVEVKLQFLNGDNNSPVPFQEITDASPEEALEFMLLDPSSTNRDQQVRVRVSDADPSQLIVSADGLAEEGKHTFAAEAKTGQSPKGGYVWPVSSARPEVTFTRVDKTKVLGLILTILEALLFAALLALIVYLIWLFSQPLRGVLYLRPGGVSREIDVPIAARRRRLTKRITGLEAFDIYKLKVRSVSKDPVVVRITITGEEKESVWEDELEQHYGFMQAGTHDAVQVNYRES